MNDEIEDPLLAVAARVGGLDATDWETAASERPDLRDTISRLQLLDRLAAAHRSARAEGEAPEPEDPAARAEQAEAIFTWGPLRAIERIGEGSFGEVWRAWDPSLQREVALKLRLAGSTATDTEPGPASGATARRWLDEARRLASVRHPNVVTVHGVAEDRGRFGMWTELVRGETLEGRVARTGPVAAHDAARIGADLCAALAEVHRVGLVHGDIKPANVMLEPRPAGESEERVVLMDFGAAHDRRWRASRALEIATGTPLVMAPEVLEGEEATPASDLYSVGVVLFHLVTGRYPYEARTLDELRDRVARGDRAEVDTLRPGLPQALVRPIERALARDPAARPRDAMELRAALLALLSPPRTLGGRGAMLLAAGSLALLGVLAWWSWSTFGGDPEMRTTPPPSASDPGLFTPTAWTLYGPSEHWNATKRVVSAGDVNGDGCEDVLVSDIDYTSHLEQQGVVRLYLGSPQGLSPTPAWSDTGHFTDGFFGHDLASAGDVNHDGYDDVIIQERRYRSGARVCSAVFLYLGSAHGLEPHPAWTHLGPGDATFFGDGLSGLGDVNGDGYDDVGIGETLARRQFDEEGAVHIFLGGPHGLAPDPQVVLHGGTTKAHMGWSVRRTGDINGDGYADLLVGFAYASGKVRDCGGVRLYLGGPLGIASTPSWAIQGSGESELLGQDVSGVGDLDEDGYDDFLVGAPGWSSWGMSRRGLIELWRGGPRGPGRTPMARIEGRSSLSALGSFARWSGDFDGDGYDDVVLTSPYYSPSEGRRRAGLIEILRGGPHGIRTDPLWTQLGDHTDDMLSYTAVFPDVNGDGRPDLVLGEPGYNADHSAGRLRLFLARGGGKGSRRGRTEGTDREHR